MEKIKDANSNVFAAMQQFSINRSDSEAVKGGRTVEYPFPCTKLVDTNDGKLVKYKVKEKWC